MAENIVGTWDVTLYQGNQMRYQYIYTCTSARTVRWFDANDQTETGVGTWARSGNQITFGWKDSDTKESWTFAPTTDGSAASGSVDASYGKFTVVATRSARTDASKDLVKQWYNAIRTNEPFSSPFVCPEAKPYLLYKPSYCDALNPLKFGPGIQKIRGLAIHTTDGNTSRKIEETVNGTVGWWNMRGGKVSAHFAIPMDGTLLQIVPTNLIAWAQGGQSDFYYVSVEIENKNKPMNGAQLETTKQLWRWVRRRFGVPPKLATGYIGPHGDGGKDAKRDYDPITSEICGDDVTTNAGTAAAASGLSCHYWLHPVKHCPGVGMLGQLAEIAKS